MQKIRKNLRLLIIASLSVMILSACGFQLRGSLALPSEIEPIMVIGKKSFRSELFNTLRVYDIKITRDKEQANSTLELIDYQSKRRTVSLGRGDKVAEYQLIETVRYQLLNKQGNTIIKPRTLTDRKILQNDSSQIASTSQERDLLRKEMRNNLIAKIIGQLRAHNFTTEKNQTSQ